VSILIHTNLMLREIKENQSASLIVAIHLIFLPKYQSPYFDTLPANSALWRSGVIESGMWHPTPLAHSLITVKTLEQQPVFILHAGPVVPILSGVVSHRRRLPIPVWIPMFDRNEVFVSHLLTV
jgi:hypothetical protein